MSQFYKALERAERERALRQSAGNKAEAVAEAPPFPDVVPPVESDRSEPEGRSLAPHDLDGVDPHLVSLLTPAALEAEQYRVLRHLVEKLHQEASTQVIGVSSPGVRDGKTTTAINLAGALAQAPEARVLLVDADLRRPGLAVALGLPTQGTKGVVDLVLSSNLPFEAAVVRLPQYNLAVLPAGSSPPASYEVLNSPRFGWLFQEAKSKFDYVVMDTPPMIPLPDCRLLQRWADGFILAVYAHRTPRRDVQKSLEVVDSAKIIGLVFNGDDGPAARYSRYYYGYYYGSRAGDGTGRGLKRLADVIRQRYTRRAR